jgi:hypothetical protein
MFARLFAKHAALGWQAVWWLPIFAILLLALGCGAWWVASDCSRPMQVLSALLGPHTFTFGELRIVWTCIVLGAGFILVILLWSTFADLTEFRQAFQAPWSGLGEDVDTAGSVEAVIRFAVILFTLVFCVGLGAVAINLAPRADTPPGCTRLNTEDSRQPGVKKNVPVTKEPEEDQRSGSAEAPEQLASSLRAIESTLAAAPVKSAPLPPTSMSGIEGRLDVLAEELRQLPKQMMPRLLADIGDSLDSLGNEVHQLPSHLKPIVSPRIETRLDSLSSEFYLLSVRMSPHSPA